MDQTRMPQSELLQNRLRDHKAESARDTKRAVQESATHRTTPGRDDDIFTEEEQDRLASKNNARQFQSSPAAPSSWRYDREPSRTRRTSAWSSSTNNTPRAMGVREMEDHIDKLSKQNFDLKMEVFHRREKVEQLEKKLQDYPQLEEDLNAALDANDELVDALEARDRAVDEAVVMITELEQRNRDLEQQLAEAKSAATRTTSASTSAGVPTSPTRRSQKTPRKSRDRRSLQGAVSPDVSARMVELAKTSDDPEEPGPLPSFLKSSEPTTAVLRSMYVEGNQVVRPIPSYATLLSNANDGNGEDIDRSLDSMDGMKSPRLSELSESDLRSIYGHEQSSDPSKEVESSVPTQDNISQQANSRVSRWVADRAISPSKPNRSRKPTSQEAEGFQSLDHVLTRQPAIPQVEIPAKPNTRRPRTQQVPEKDGHTPPMPINPVFGQNVFPPTPDTMMTRPSNNSTTSFVQDGNPFEAPSSGTRAPPASGPQNQSTLLISPKPRKQAVTPNSLLPQEFDAYGSPPRERRPAQLDGSLDFGEPMYNRGYSSDGSYAAEPVRRQGPHRQASLAGSTAIDADSLRDVVAARSSPSPPRLFDSRRPSGEIFYPALESRPKGEVFGGYSQTQLSLQSNQATPTHSSFAPRNHTRGMSGASSIQTPRQTQPLPAAMSSGIPIMPRQAPAPPTSATMGSSPSVKSTTSLAARTASIRNRFSRRKTTAAAVEEAATPTIPGRSNGIAQRLWFRRSSSEQGPAPMLQRNESEQFNTATKPSPSTPFWSSERGVAMSAGSGVSIPSPPQRSKSERRRPSLSFTTRSNQSNTSFSSMPGRGKGMTPSEESSIGDEASQSPGGGQRRSSFSRRLSSSGRKGGSKSDIPPVPKTPTEYLKWESEPEPARSRWRLGGRSRSNSRTRPEPVWPTTLTGFDGTAAGKRG